MAIFPAGVSSEFRDAAGGVWQPDDAEEFGNGCEERGCRGEGAVEVGFGIGKTKGAQDTGNLHGRAEAMPLRVASGWVGWLSYG